MVVKNMLNYLSYLPKRFIAFFMITLLTVLPLQGLVAQEEVRLESNVGVANVTAGDTQYKDGVSAKVDEVVKVQVWYHNMENENSGKIANDLKVKIKLPTQKGKAQIVQSTVSADNANTVVDTASVNLTLDNAYLEYIPGSAKWRHNAGSNAQPNWVTEGISDNVVNGGVVLEDAKPCFNFEATVTVLARVKASVISVQKQVRKVGEKEWKTENTANPNDTLEYQIRVKNEGNTVLHNVLVGDNMPAFVTYVSGSTKLMNSNFPTGTTISSDNVTTGGINIGDAAPGGVSYVMFQAKIDKSKFEKPGSYVLTNVAVADSDETDTFENYAKTTILVQVTTERPPEPPVVQPPLPVTGPETALLGIGGSGALGVAIRSFIRSRKGLLEALLNK